MRRGLLLHWQSGLEDICPGWEKMLFPEAEEMAAAWSRRLEQVTKWQQEVKRQSRSEEEPWYKVEASETDHDHKVRKIQSLGEDSKKNDSGIHCRLGEEIVEKTRNRETNQMGSWEESSRDCLGQSTGKNWRQWVELQKIALSNVLLKSESFEGSLGASALQLLL